MLGFNHAAFGLILGHITGHPLVGFLSSTLIDMDHVWGYYKHKKLKFNKEFFTDLFSNNDLNLRLTIFHSIWGLMLTSFIVYHTLGENICFTWILGYASHLIMDCFDSVEINLIYPFKVRSLDFDKGLFRYNSRTEYVIFIFLMLSYLVLIKI